MSKTKAAEPGIEKLARDKRIWARHAMWAVQEEAAHEAALMDLPDSAGNAELVNPLIRQPALGARAVEAQAEAEADAPVANAPAEPPATVDAGRPNQPEDDGGAP